MRTPGAGLVLALLLLTLVLVLGPIPDAACITDTHWLLWLLGPATVAFGVPIYEYRDLIRRHALSLAATERLGGTPDLAALFVVITGVCGMVLGAAVLALLPLHSHLARGALLTMILAGVTLVLLEPLLSRWLG